MGNAVVTMLPPYDEYNLVRNLDCVEWCAHDGDITCLHIRGRETISVRL